MDVGYWEGVKELVEGYMPLVLLPFLCVGWNISASVFVFWLVG
jgi:hypothetical protein